MTGPSVSVVVPTRDRPELLRAALDAILGQDYPGADRVRRRLRPVRAATSSLDAAEPAGRCGSSPTPARPGLAGARNTGILAAHRRPGRVLRRRRRVAARQARRPGRALDADPTAPLVELRHPGRATTGTDGRPPLDRCRVSLEDLLRDRLTELHPSTFLIRRAAAARRVRPGRRGDPGQLRRGLRVPAAGRPDAPLVNVRQRRRAGPLAQAVVLRAAAGRPSRRRCTWLLERYPEFATVPAGEARVAGQIAFAQAATGNRRGALRWARRTLARNPQEPRAYLALAVALGRCTPTGCCAAAQARPGHLSGPATGG